MDTAPAETLTLLDGSGDASVLVALFRDDLGERGVAVANPLAFR